MQGSQDTTDGNNSPGKDYVLYTESEGELNEWIKVRSIHVPVSIYVGRKVWICESMDCAAQTIDLYFVQAIRGLHVHICLSFLLLIVFIIF